jgi:glycosyltransferase involved in cell wall biosynthesis
VVDRRWCVVLPSLKVSGGVREAIRLAENCEEHGAALIVSMWRSEHPMNTRLNVEYLSARSPRPHRAPFEFPLLFLRFWRVARRNADTHFVFTHYTTLPLSLSVPRHRRFFFVQDLEWKFVPKQLESLLRKAILYFYRHGRVVTANTYLTAALGEQAITIAREAPIWADPAFLRNSSAARDIDCVMMLRKGVHKRLDLYLSFIELAQRAQLRLAVISPEDALISAVKDRVAAALLRPTLREMAELYSRSKCFVHLSDHEGFGLPPLEAMAAGCVPICRDSGGVRAFMNGALQDQLLACDLSVENIFERTKRLLRSEAEWQRLSALARSTFEQGVRETQAQPSLASFDWDSAFARE